MTKRSYFCAVVLVLVYFGGAGAQRPVLDTIAEKVILKYQQSSCEQLLKQKSQPKTAREQQFVQMLRDNPQMRTEFINQIAAPIANRMFDCGMIP